jgi:hypothetical protein
MFARRLQESLPNCYLVFRNGGNLGLTENCFVSASSQLMLVKESICLIGFDEEGKIKNHMRN